MSQNNFCLVAEYFSFCETYVKYNYFNYRIFSRLNNGKKLWNYQQKINYLYLVLPLGFPGSVNSLRHGLQYLAVEQRMLCILSVTCL